jgi:hypothetical protein
MMGLLRLTKEGPGSRLAAIHAQKGIDGLAVLIDAR